MKRIDCNMADVPMGLPENIARVVSECGRDVVNAHGGLYDPETDGWLALVEEGDDPRREYDELGGRRLDGVLYEGVLVADGCIVAAVGLGSGDWGITVVCPDMPWLPRDVRNAMLACGENPGPSHYGVKAEVG